MLQLRAFNLQVRALALSADGPTPVPSWSPGATGNPPQPLQPLAITLVKHRRAAAELTIGSDGSAQLRADSTLPQ